MSSTLLLIQTLNAICLGMNIFIVACGLTIVFGVLRIVNFAHGSLYMLGAYTLYAVTRMMGDTNLGYVTGLIASAAAIGCLAFVIERYLLARLYDKEHWLQLLFTFALVLILDNVAREIWGVDVHSVSTPPFLSGATNLGIVRYPTYLLFLSVVGVVIAIALWFMLEKSRLGRIVRAAHLDREMLGALGVNVKTVYSGVFAMGAVLAALGGAMAAPRVSVDPGMGGLIVIDCFVVIIIGGMGSLMGSFIGALCLGFVTVFGAVYLQGWEIVLTYGLLIAFLLLRPWGLMGESDYERH